jgi:pantothenate kinase type III
MAQALHNDTALLPFVQVTRSEPPLPGRSTPEAIEAGVFWAVAGGIRSLVEELSAPEARHPHDIYLTGGDAPLLEPVLGRLLTTVPNRRVVLMPNMTLEGVRLAAEANP